MDASVYCLGNLPPRPQGDALRDLTAFTLGGRTEAWMGDVTRYKFSFLLLAIKVNLVNITP